MPPRRPRNVETLSPEAVKVHLSDQARQAFADLDATVHFSDHFQPEILLIVQDFAKGADVSIMDVICSLPSIAEQTFRHIHATGDERARKAWREICHALPEEKGFTLTRERVRRDHFSCL
jgi:hypothetical protein